MIRTPVCDLLGIEVPVLCAPFGPWDQVELAAAVSAAGGLGCPGTAVRSVPELREQWARLRRLTDRPFAVNHQMRPFDEEAFAATLDARVPIVSFHMGVPADLIAPVHDSGALAVQQVMDRRQAEAAVRAGADVIIAQGGEAGGHGGWVAGSVLVPQVVDADAVDTVEVVNDDALMASYSRPGVHTEGRALRTPLIDTLPEHPERIDPAATGPELMAAVRRGRGDEYLPFAGPTAGLVHDVLPAAEIIRRVLAEAEAALAAASARVVAAPIGAS